MHEEVIGVGPDPGSRLAIGAKQDITVTKCRIILARFGEAGPKAVVVVTLIIPVVAVVVVAVASVGGGLLNSSIKLSLLVCPSVVHRIRNLVGSSTSSN